MKASRAAGRFVDQSRSRSGGGWPSSNAAASLKQIAKLFGLAGSQRHSLQQRLESRTYRAEIAAHPPIADSISRLLFGFVQLPLQIVRRRRQYRDASNLHSVRQKNAFLRALQR